MRRGCDLRLLSPHAPRSTRLGAVVVDDAEYFLRTVDELCTRGSSTDRYELVKASGLLRLLLLDGLLDRTNRAHKLKLSYEILGDGSSPPVPSSKLFVHWIDIDATRAPPAALRRRVDRDGLLGEAILAFKGSQISVRDLVDAASNSMGGVHRGTPKDERQQRVIDLDAVLREGAMPEMMAGVLGRLGISAQVPDAVSALRGLIAVVLRGIQPLADAVRESMRKP